MNNYASSSRRCANPTNLRRAHLKVAANLHRPHVTCSSGRPFAWPNGGVRLWPNSIDTICFAIAPATASPLIQPPFPHPLTTVQRKGTKLLKSKLNSRRGKIAGYWPATDKTMTSRHVKLTKTNSELFKRKNRK